MGEKITLAKNARFGEEKIGKKIIRAKAQRRK